ncbi:MAG: hypothetical protein R2939_08765 [Kofleriaceae bacterium]
MKSAESKVVGALSNVLRSDSEELDLALFGAAINALGDLRSAEAVPALIEAMYAAGAVRPGAARAGGQRQHRRRRAPPDPAR